MIAYNENKRNDIYILFLCLSLFLAATGIKNVYAFHARTLTREADAIEISGKDLPMLLGIPIERIRCLAWRGDRWTPIPFQIDQRKEVKTKSGEIYLDYVFPYGPSADQDRNPNFGENDLLVLLAKDLGDQNRSKAVMGPVCAAGEIEVKDPRNDTGGWIYVFTSGEEIPLSPADHIQYSDSEHSLRTEYYGISFSRTNPILFSGILMKTGNNTEERNILDQLKLRIEGTIFFHSIHFNKDESDFRSRLVAWIDGPIRVIRRTKNSVYLIWGIYSPSLLQDTIFYPQHFFFNIHLVSPVELRALITYADIRASADLNTRAVGMLFYNSLNPSGCLVDGFLSDQERYLRTGNYTWSAVSGVSGTMFNRLLLGKNLPISIELYYDDNQMSPDPPEKVPGEIGDVGFRLSDLTRLGKDIYDLTFHNYFCGPYLPGDEDRFLDIVDHPLVWECHPLECRNPD